MNKDLSSLYDVKKLEQAEIESRRVPVTSYDVLQESARKFGSSSAIEFFLDAERLDNINQISYVKLAQEVTRTANMFRSYGVERGDVVAFLLPNLPETHYVIWGAEAAGVIFALNPLLESEQLATLIESAKTKWLVCLGPTPGSDIWEKSVAASSRVSSLKGIFQLNISPYLSGIKKAAIEATSFAARLSASAKLKIPVKSFSAEISKHNAEALTFDEPKKNDLASYFCTGGTTGLPKIAMRKHRSEVFNAWSILNTFQRSFALGSGVFCGLPLFHVNGQIVTGLTAFMGGVRVVMGTPLGYRGKGVIKNFWRIIERFQLEAFSGVPTIYAAILEEPIGDRDIACLRSAICGSAPLPKEIYRKFFNTTKVPIIEGYGLTEGTCVSSVNPGLSEDTIGSIGFRLPFQEMKAMVLDDDGNYVRDAEPNEVGVIAIKGPNVFEGYIQEQHNQGIWINRLDETWLNTGDLGREDKEGYFWLTGRKKELIIRGGHNIDPKSIEETLHEHPDVKLAAAVGRPDKYSGELPVAYVELSENSSVAERELIKFVQVRLPERAAWPKAITILSKLPVTPVGKLYKPALSMMEIERVVKLEAKGEECSLFEVSVEQNPKHGLVAKIKAEGNISALEKRLDEYSFSYQLVK